jgi:hypothetical protein
MVRLERRTPKQRTPEQKGPGKTGAFDLGGTPKDQRE